jgi:hypothetical protein
MFGMIVLTVIFYVIVWLLINVIIFAIVALAGGGQHAAQDMLKLTPVAAIAFLVTTVMQLILQILQVVMIYAPFGVAYQQLHGDAPARQPRQLQPG